MTFAKRVERRRALIGQMKPDRIAPAATIQRPARAGAWTAGSQTERLARLCRQAVPRLAHGASAAGHRLRVGLAGGRRWLWLDDRQVLRLDELLAGSSDDAQLQLAELEILDLSGLDIRDWQGDLVEPQRLRLVLLAPARRWAEDGTAEEAFTLALDFDTRILTPAQAADLLDGLIRGLSESDGA